MALEVDVDVWRDEYAEGLLLEHCLRLVRNDIMSILERLEVGHVDISIHHPQINGEKIFRIFNKAGLINFLEECVDTSALS